MLNQMSNKLQMISLNYAMENTSRNKNLLNKSNNKKLNSNLC